MASSDDSPSDNAPTFASRFKVVRSSQLLTKDVGSGGKRSTNTFKAGPPQNRTAGTEQRRRSSGPGVGGESSGDRAIRRTTRAGGGRPLPQQIALNKQLIECKTAQQVLDTVEWAQEEELPLNSVNFATAFHRIAKTNSGGGGINLRLSETYCRLLDRVIPALNVLPPAPRPSSASYPRSFSDSFRAAAYGAARSANTSSPASRMSGAHVTARVRSAC